MAKKSWYMTGLLVAIVSFGLVVSCASLKAGSSPTTLTPVEIMDVSVERLNPIAADKYQKTDVFVFNTTFTFSNPQEALARISDFNLKSGWMMVLMIRLLSRAVQCPLHISLPERKLAGLLLRPLFMGE